MRSAPPSDKQLICCVRPGVLLVKASRFCWQSVLIALDFPAFERPAKAISGASEVGRPCGWFTDIRNRAEWSRAGDMFRNGRACALKRRKTMRAENFEHVGECMKHVRERLGKIDVRQDALERRRRTSARVELRGKRVFAVHIDTCANHYDTGLVCDLDRFD